MSNRTWACVPCRKSYRRGFAVTAVVCASCHAACEFVHWKVRIPSPKRPKEWDEFWAEYRAEKAILEAFRRGELHEAVELRLLGMVLPARTST